MAKVTLATTYTRDSPEDALKASAMARIIAKSVAIDCSSRLDENNGTARVWCCVHYETV